MEPYEKLFSPKRIIRKSSRLSAKVGSEKDEQGTSKKVKEERETKEGKGTIQVHVCLESRLMHTHTRV